MTRIVAIHVGGQPLDLSRPEDRARYAEMQVAVVRMRNFGASLAVIADKLGLTEEDAETLLQNTLRQIWVSDADEVRARQQATLNDIRRAMYPGMELGDDKSAGVILRVLDHEANLHGLKAPTRVRVGLDQEEFTTTVDDDMRALGIHPRMDVPLSEDDPEPWANT